MEYARHRIYLGGKLSAALLLLSACLSAPQDELARNLAGAQTALAESRDDEARLLLDGILKADPSRAQANYLNGVLLACGGKRSSALTALRQLQVRKATGTGEETRLATLKANELRQAIFKAESTLPCLRPEASISVANDNSPSPVKDLSTPAQSRPPAQNSQRRQGFEDRE